MSVPRRATLTVLLGALGVVALALPGEALAHGIVGRADLPIPVWLFSWAAAIVLVVSFVALSTLWRTPQLQDPHARDLFHLPAPAEWLASLIGVGLFGVVVYSGFAGAQVPTANFSVTFIYVVFWVGVPVLSVFFGDLFRAFSPWRACARVGWAVARTIPRIRAGGPPLRYPGRLGMWPAAAGIVGFAWLELVYILPDKDHPSTLASLSVAYFLIMLAGMALFGVEEWGGQADAFGVYFGLLARLAPLFRNRDGRLSLRRPLSGLTALEVGPGTLAVICTIIGTTTFDGFSNGGVWRNVEPELQSLVADLGFNQTPSIEITYSLGMLFCLGLIAGTYRLGIIGVRSVSTRYDSRRLVHAFAHTLVPIGFAYVLAHYFSLLIWQSQAMAYLASDPLGNGSNLFGTAGDQIDYHIVSYAAIWYVQVGALVAGHVSGLALAHDRALVLYRDVEEAVRSQYWMLAVMVAYTSFGLWLLSSVGT
jgi:hypothetical protein